MYTDYYWKKVGLVGEIDGREKYMKPEYLKGRTPSQVVIEEKEREDAIRATGRRVFRLVWSDLTLGRLERAGGSRGSPPPSCFCRPPKFIGDTEMGARHPNVSVSLPFPWRQRIRRASEDARRQRGTRKS